MKKILDGIDPKVEAAFEQGEAGARSAFESYVAAKMSAYKKDRYGGWLGGFRWAKDKLRRDARRRSTSSTRPAASSTSSRWTASSPGSPTSSATT